jgi:two-component system chemotaxis response regulator CheB
MIRVLCVEDDATIRSLITELLAQDPELNLVGLARDVSSACAYLRHETVDVLVLDLCLGGRDGMQLVEAMRMWPESYSPDGRCPAVVFCTGFADERFEAEARRAGAAGLVPKTEVTRALVPAVRSAAEGKTWFPREQAAAC